MSRRNGIRGKRIPPGFREALKKRLEIWVKRDGLYCGQCARLYEEIGTEPKCWSKPCKNSDCMFPGLEEWLAFWVFIRFSPTAERIGVPFLLKQAQVYNDLESLELLMLMDGWYAEFYEKYRD